MIKLKKDNSYNIIVVGTGGTGSHFISFLSQLIGNNKVYKTKHKITLIDGDIIEEHNLRTQKFLPEDIGKLKAEVLADRYSSVFDISIGYIDRYIEKQRDITDLLDSSYGDVNIVISCVDNNKARRIIDKAFNENKRSNIIYIDTGNSSGSDELYGQTIVGYNELGTIKLPSVSNYFPLDDEKEEPVASCGEVMVRNIQNIGANITSACTVFNIINSIVSFGSIPGDVFTFNATSIEASSMKINARE